MSLGLQLHLQQLAIDARRDGLLNAAETLERELAARTFGDGTRCPVCSDEAARGLIARLREFARRHDARTRPPDPWE